jgi:hypothetical protein
VLRAGGIHEKWFAVSASRFLLFQRVAHSHAERVRPEHRDLLDDAAADSSDHAIVLRASAKVVVAISKVTDAIHRRSSPGCENPGGTGARSRI